MTSQVSRLVGPGIVHDLPGLQLVGPGTVHDLPGLRLVGAGTVRDLSCAECCRPTSSGGPFPGLSSPSHTADGRHSRERKGRGAVSPEPAGLRVLSVLLSPGSSSL